ncbi:hypothetical protein GCM10023185_23300 [Hymenobacter saemangeumensis]|uniref:Uncharacterized protein n=1 Tax=Hymenobacter saemangeumensis TaxID=1084522 RepID=A0ABP8IGB4_9BACT
MRPEDIDNLFRGSLDDHASTPPPADALFARLQQAQAEQAEPAIERLDTLYQSKLSAHVTPPGRELWERLEDEHLRPRKRRVAAWWPMAVAAVVALLLVAGGAGLLLNGRVQPAGPGELARTHTPGSKGRVVAPGAEAAASPAALATASPLAEKNRAAQATDLASASSSAPEASTARPLAPATTAYPAPGKATTRKPAKASAGLLAQQQPRQSGPTAAGTPAPEPQLPARDAPVVAAVASPSSTAAASASPAGVIEVEVRRGELPVADVPPGADAPPLPTRRGLGKLLDRATVAVRDAKQGLLDRANLPDNVTVHARLGDRTLSKTIEL